MWGGGGFHSHFSLSGVLGVDSLNFTKISLPLQLFTTDSLVLMVQQTKGKRFKDMRPFTVPYFLRVIAMFWERLWVRIETICQAVGTKVTTPCTSSIIVFVNAGCSYDETTNTYFKVDHAIQKMEARFSQRHQGLVLADMLSEAKSINTLL